MNIIIGSVGSGKTYKLVELAHNTNKVIVCSDIYSVRTIEAIAKKEGFNILNPITYSELQKCLPDADVEYLIDDLGHFFDCTYNLKISTITINDCNIKKSSNTLNQYTYDVECTTLCDFEKVIFLGYTIFANNIEEAERMAIVNNTSFGVTIAIKNLKLKDEN